MLLSLILPLTATPLPTSGPATACIPGHPSSSEVTEPFAPPDPGVQVRVRTPTGRTLLRTDTEQDQGLSNFRWLGRGYCLGYGAQAEGTFVLVQGETRDGVVLLGSSGTHSATIRRDQWQRSFGRLALEIHAEPLSESPAPSAQSPQ